MTGSRIEEIRARVRANAAELMQDILLHGCTFTVDGVRVDPMTVRRTPGEKDRYEVADRQPSYEIPCKDDPK